MTQAAWRGLEHRQGRRLGHLCHRYLETAVTIEMQMRFLRPVTSDCRCEARRLRPGRHAVHLESRLYDSGGRLAAFAAGSRHRSNSGDSGVPHG
ncbi:MAG TPA: hotdog domain-containing protein [Streptosporangiaceae bacterium]|nr:hotdog domain-containing protein [Streptosporangiaceae bacterium]